MKKKGNPNRKRKGELSKGKVQEMHAKSRAYHRYGLTLNNADLNDIKFDIETGKASFMEQQSQRVSVFSVNVQNQNIPVVYDNMRSTIVTFLPQTYFATGSLRNKFE